MSDLEAVTNISRFETEKYYSFINGRLPVYVEWALAAYTQLFNKDNFKKVTYVYPSGNFPKNVNAQELLEYNKHVKVILLPEGINGLVAMAKMFGNGLMINVNKALWTAYGSEKTKGLVLSISYLIFMQSMLVSDVLLIIKKLV